MKSRIITGLFIIAALLLLMMAIKWDPGTSVENEGKAGHSTVLSIDSETQATEAEQLEPEPEPEPEPLDLTLPRLDPADVSDVNTEGNTLLPNLFEQKQRTRALSVSGHPIMDMEEDEPVDKLKGAELKFEVKTK